MAITPDRLSHSDLSGGAAVYWLLDLTWAGQTIRLSDGDVDVTDEDGTIHHYTGGLDEVEIEEAVDLLADTSTSPTSVALLMRLPVDVPLLVSQGHDLASATGSLSRWVDGTLYERRRVVLRGILSDPEYGDADEPVNASLEASVWIDQGTIPAARQRVNLNTWSSTAIASLGEGEKGLYYPIVFGTPGVVSTAVRAFGYMAATQAVWGDHDNVAVGGGGELGNLTLVLAGHHVSATSVIGVTATVGGDLFYFQVLNGYDTAGNPIAFIPWYSTTTAADPFTYDGVPGNYTFAARTVGGTNIWPLGATIITTTFQPEVDEVFPIFIAWKDIESGGGGMVNDRGELVRSGGDVLEVMMRYTALPVDRGRFAAARGLLARFLLDFMIDEAVPPWDFVRSNILPLLPVSIVSGPDGTFPLVWRYDAVASDAAVAFDLDANPAIERASAMVYDRSQIRNRIIVRYAWSPRVSEYLGEVMLDADDAGGGTPDLYCRVSQARYKTTEGNPLIVEHVIDARCIYDDSTALLVAQWNARAYALARRRVSYSVLESDYAGRIERGQVATLTDGDLYLDEQVCLVEFVRTDGSGRLTVGLLIVEDPARDLHS